MMPKMPLPSFNSFITTIYFQMAYLEDWALLERDHATSLNGAIKDLEACTLRLPVTGGAKVRQLLQLSGFWINNTKQIPPFILYHIFWRSSFGGINNFVFLQADIDSLKAAVSSAVDVMQAMGSSVCSVLSKVR